MQGNRNTGIVNSEYEIKEPVGLLGYKAWKAGYDDARARGMGRLKSAWHASENIPPDMTKDRRLEVKVDANTGKIHVDYRTVDADGVSAYTAVKDANRILSGVKSATFWQRFKYWVNPEWQSKGLWYVLTKPRPQPQQPAPNPNPQPAPTH